MDAETDRRSAKSRRVTLPIHGLARGGGGALAAERALVRVAGVRKTYVNPLTEMAYVEYDPTIARPAQLVAAVERVGLGAGEPSLR